MLKAWYFTIVKYIRNALLDYAIINNLRMSYSSAICELWFKNGGTIYGLLEHKIGG